MKYIRTKDGIYNNIEIDEVWGFLCNNPQTYGDVYIGTDKVIKGADTIEELCDEFVVVNWKEIGKPKLSIAKDNCGIWFVDEYMQVETIFIPDLLKSKIDIYGAIWTDKGLIYVAKMNDKGELGLL